MAKKPRRISTSDSNYTPSNPQPNTPPSKSESEDSDNEDSVCGGTPPPSPTHEVLVPSNLSSPPPISICISISPIPKLITSQPTITLPIPAPIFSEATTTTTKTTEPTVHANVSDTRVRTPSTETNTVLGGEGVDYDSFDYSPFGVQSDDDDDDAPITKKH